MPSFVVTLAGLLFWQGVILYSIGDTGVITIDNELVNNVSNYFFSDTAGLRHRPDCDPVIRLLDALRGHQ